MNIYYALAMAIVIKLRRNWYSNAAMLPVPTRMAAFTLIELSIVLVIIGWIVGGVLVGQDLVRAAELRQTHAKFIEFDTAVMTFKLKYNALPGDMKNATDFFGIAAGNGQDNTCYNSAVTTATCNGNGDKMLPCGSGADQCHEFARVMQQLALAKLMEGEYTGTRYQNYNVWYEGTQQSFYRLRTLSAYYSVPNLAILGFEVVGFNSNRTALAGFITPIDAMNIDTKVDDGDPDEGSFMAYRLISGCATVANTVTDGSGEYDLTDEDKNCAIMFLK